MSGGVDSSVAAVLLLEKFPDADIVGVTMRLWSASDDKYRPGGCCSLEDISDAARVSRSLGIKHYVFNYEDIFKEKVAEPFLKDYLKGLTPNPCVVCNEELKFGVLVSRARALGFDYVATGHYARIAAISVSPGVRHFLIKKAVDEKKDQSYFLWRVPQSVLPGVIFPVGDYSKEEIRRIASEAKLPVARKRESHDVCFVPGDYRKFVSSYINSVKKSSDSEGKFPSRDVNSGGEIVDKNGRVLGRHDGIYNFTVGQRSGLGVSSAERLYVIKIEPQSCRIVVGKREDALVKNFRVRDWILHAPYDKLFAGKKSDGQKGKVFDVKIRYHTPSYKAIVRRGDSDEVVRGGREKKFFLEVEIKEGAVFGVTPGQSAVFYDVSKGVVAGGGIISAD